MNSDISSGSLTRHALTLARELVRRKRRNLLAGYRPYARQREFHDAGAQHRERLFMAGNQLGKTLAGSFEWGKPCVPAYGAICILSREGGGHVFFVTGISAKFVWGIGGNQSDKVCEAKFDRARVLGFRWPAPCPAPTPLLPGGETGAALSEGEA